MYIDGLFILIWTVIKVLAILIPVVGVVAFLTVIERKVIGYIQGRVGPNRVGFRGILQPVADGLKLLCKEIILPKVANKGLFILSPILFIAPSLAAWAVIPFSYKLVLANINAGLLYILAMSSLAVYGILIAGWASNSKYAFLGALRSAAQMISYEIAMGFALVGVLVASGTMNLREIVLHQGGGITHWYWLPLFPLFLVYWIAGIAETNRAPFDMAEGEAEIVAGFHVEYGGITFALFFLAEYANMILISALATTLFLGGWLSPVEGIPYLNHLLNWIPGIGWFCVKVSVFLGLYLWIRATFPRYRYDQVMRLGWKVLIPVTIVWVTLASLAVQFHVAPWFV